MAKRVRNATWGEAGKIDKKERELKANDRKTGGNSYGEFRKSQDKQFKAAQDADRRDAAKRKIVGGSGGIKRG